MVTRNKLMKMKRKDKMKIDLSIYEGTYLLIFLYIYIKYISDFQSFLFSSHIY